MTILPYEKLFRLTGTGKRGLSIDELIEDEATVLKNYETSHFYGTASTPIRQIAQCSSEERVTEEIADLFSMKKGTVAETSEQFAKRIFSAYRRSLFSMWDPNKFHVVLHSSGYDSRLLSLVIKSLFEEHGKSWLGDILFVCGSWETPSFVRIMEAEGWTKDQYLCHSPSGDYWKEMLEFDTAWENLYFPRSLPINYMLYPPRDAARAGRCPLNDDAVQFAMGYGSGIGRGCMQPVNKLGEYYRWWLTTESSTMPAFYSHHIYPVQDLDVLRTAIESSVAIGMEWTRLVVSFVNAEVGKIPNLWGYYYDWQNKAQMELSQSLFSQVIKDYSASWYGINVCPQAVQKATKVLHYSAWWSRWSIAAIVERLFKRGVKLGAIG